ncbi:tetratricopeptide repeat protein, partial [Candidatus Omnitrophota bacterium]
LSAFDLAEAKKNFKSSISILPDTDTAHEANFRLGVCERLLGNLNESVTIFGELIGKTSNAELRMQAQYQISQIYRQRGMLEECTSSLNSLISEHEGEAAAPMLMFQLGSTYLFDSRDSDKAEEVFKRLRNEFPAAAVTYPGADFIDEYIESGVIARLPEELAKLKKRTVFESLIPKKIQNVMRRTSMQFAVNLIDLILETAKNNKARVGGQVRIEITEEDLNEQARNWFPSDRSGMAWDITFDFLGNEKLKIYGYISLPNGGKIKSYMIGRLYRINILDATFDQNTGRRNAFLIFEAQECKVGIIPVTPDLTNMIIRPCIEYFNKGFPVDIQEYRFDTEAIMINGIMAEDVTRGVAANKSMVELEVESIGGEDSGYAY